MNVAVLLVIQAECAGLHVRRADVAVGNDVHALLRERLLGAALRDCGPFQHDPRARIGHLRAEGEGVDGRGHAVDGIIRDVADEVVVGHRAGDRAEDELGLVDAQVIRAHVVIAGQQRAVEDFHLRMRDGLADAGVQEHRGRGEDDVIALRSQAVDDGLRLLLLDVFAERGLHACAEFLFQRLAAQLVPVGPGGALRRAVVEEGAAQHLRRAAQHGGEEGLLLFARLIEQHGGLVGSGHDEFRPDLADIPSEIRGRFADAVRIAEHVQIDEERVADGQGRVGALAIRLGEAMIAGLQVADLVAGPLVPGLLVQHRIEALEAALTVEIDEVDAAVGIEPEELLIHAVALGVLRLGQDAGDVGLDGHRVERAHDADALVALDDVEAVIVFVGEHRIAQAVLHDVVVQDAPLERELRIDVQQRHEIAREGGGAAAGRGARNLIERNLNQAQRNLRQTVELRNKLAEHGQRGVLAAGLQGMGQTLSPFLCPQIIFG